MQVSALNHVLFTVVDVDRAARFYEDVLGMWRVVRGDVTSLHFSGGAVVLVADPSAVHPLPAAPSKGSGDVCFLVSGSINDWQDRVEAAGVEVIEGPVDRLASEGAVHSVYLRDPDGNLIELAGSSSTR